MIVCDNIVFELQQAGGISKYWAKTIERLDGKGRNLCYLEGCAAQENIFRRELRLGHEIIRERGPLFWRRFEVLRAPQGKVFHSSYYRISRVSKYNVVTIHDFMNEFFPNSFRDVILSRLKKKAALAANRIIVVSECTKRDLLKCYPGVDPKIIQVIYNGVDSEFWCEKRSDSFEVQGQAIEPGAYFLYVGTRGYCKNFPFVQRFIAAAVSQGMDVQLVLVGGGKLNLAERRRLAELNVSEDRIIQFQGVKTEDLRRLYSNAIALLVPSLYEGFGIPALEGARCKAIIVAADGSALTEIVGESDYLINLQRSDEISRILRIGFDGQIAESERERVHQRSLRFGWDRATEQLLEVYDSLQI